MPQSSEHGDMIRAVFIEKTPQPDPTRSLPWKPIDGGVASDDCTAVNLSPACTSARLICGGGAGGAAHLESLLVAGQQPRSAEPLPQPQPLLLQQASHQVSPPPPHPPNPPARRLRHSHHIAHFQVHMVRSLGKPLSRLHTSGIAQLVCKRCGILFCSWHCALVPCFKGNQQDCMCLFC